MKVVFVVFLSTISSFFAQQKFEKEYRITATEAPEKAAQFIKNLNLNTKQKWYAEESNDGKTFEVKACFKKHKYSIEFSEKGDVLDIEKTVKYRKLNVVVQEQINKLLSKRFKKYKIKKLQIQYTSQKYRLFRNVFQTEKNLEQMKINYELIVKGKVDKAYSRFEILINDRGKLVKELPFPLRNSLNIEF